MRTLKTIVWLCALAAPALVSAAPVQVVRLKAATAAPGLAEALAARLQAAGGVGDLRVVGADLWWIGEQPLPALAGVLEAGTLRFAPAVSEPGAPLPAGATACADLTTPTKTWGVDLARAVLPHIETAEVVDTPYGEQAVMVAFDAAGAKAFHALTTQLVDRKLAILLDDQVVSVPVVREPIPGGRAQITLGHDGRGSATLLAARLRTGPLPAAVSVVSTAQGDRVDAAGTTTVTGAGAPPPYPTPKRWQPIACRLSGRPDCAVAIVR